MSFGLWISTGSLIGQNPLAQKVRNHLIAQANAMSISINDTRTVFTSESKFPLSTRTIHKVLSSLGNRSKIFRMSKGRVFAKVKFAQKVKVACAWIKYILTFKHLARMPSWIELLAKLDQGEKPP